MYSDWTVVGSPEYLNRNQADGGNLKVPFSKAAATETEPANLLLQGCSANACYAQAVGVVNENTKKEDLKLKCVIFGDTAEETAAPTGYILDCNILSTHVQPFS